MKAQPENVQGWDDLIFENRNKAYGAYTIRQGYTDRVLKGLLLTAGTAVCLIMVAVYSGNQSIIPPLPAKDEIGIVINPPPDIKVIEATRTEPVKPVVNRVLPPKPVQHDVPVVDLPAEQPAVSAATDGTVTAGISGSDAATMDTGAGVVVDTAPKTFDHAEVMPAYEGGYEAMMRFLQKKLRYPARPRKMNIQGTVFVQFVIDAQGNVTNVQVIKGIDKDCDAEAARVIAMMTEWNAGVQNKVPVNVRMVLPIRFKLAE